MSRKLIETIKSFGREALTESHGQRYTGSGQSMRKRRMVKRTNKLAQEEDNKTIGRKNPELNPDPTLDSINQTR